MKNIFFLPIIIFCISNTYSQKFAVSGKIAVMGDDDWDYLSVNWNRLPENQHPRPAILPNSSIILVID